MVWCLVWWVAWVILVELARGAAASMEQGVDMLEGAADGLGVVEAA